VDGGPPSNRLLEPSVPSCKAGALASVDREIAWAAKGFKSD
jgi:hypothetical protein